MIKLFRANCLFCESKDWWFKSPFGQYFYHGCFFITTCSCMLFCKTFYYQEKACIYPPNARNSECQIFYSLTFSVGRSKFLERTLILTSHFKCAWSWFEAGKLSRFIPPLYGAGGSKFSFHSQADQIPSLIEFWAEHYDLSPDKHIMFQGSYIYL